jgi:C7-C12 aromatase (ARO/CYC)
MGHNSSRTVEHRAVVDAPAAVVFDTVAEVERWPQYFRPAVHAEYLERGESYDVVQRWALVGDTAVHTWTSRRDLDRDGLRIAFEQLDVEAPLRRMGGEWVFKAVSDGQCEVEVRHSFEAVDAEAAARTEADLQRKAGFQLDTVKSTAERHEELAELVLSFEDPLFIGGRAEDAYAVLYEADRWPERIEHVLSLTLTEDVPNVQFFDMDTRTPDGAAHTTRSVRICLPHRKIVYKQIRLPKLLDGHTGHWLFTPTPEGLIASARHTVTIKPAAIQAVLGDSATVGDARRYLRTVLSANSMKNLQLAKRWAEERA